MIFKLQSSFVYHLGLNNFKGRLRRGRRLYLLKILIFVAIMLKLSSLFLRAEGLRTLASALVLSINDMMP